MDGGSKVPGNGGSARGKQSSTVFLERACDTKMALCELPGCDVEDGLKERRQKTTRPVRGGLNKRCKA